MATTGLELKVKRVAADVKLNDLAARMGRSRATVWHYERQASVAEATVREYLDALATFGDVSTPGDPAAPTETAA